MRQEKKAIAYVAFGSNMGDRRANIEKAIRLIQRIKGVKLGKASSIYETEPDDGRPQGKFLNGAFEMKTNINAFQLLKELKKIERNLGRKKGARYAPRTIDLDILLFGDKRINTRKLQIPHPRMHKREFVLRPLRELGRL